ncbi:MAG: hypothetical protein ACKPKO_00660, partial [Candidatus Fonsibacter sp.]
TISSTIHKSAMLIESTKGPNTTRSIAMHKAMCNPSRIGSHSKDTAAKGREQKRKITCRKRHINTIIQTIETEREREK